MTAKRKTVDGLKRCEEGKGLGLHDEQDVCEKEVPGVTPGFSRCY